MGIEQIDHFFVLMLENRSFDHLLGYSGISGRDAVTAEQGTVDGLIPDIQANQDVDGANYWTTTPAPRSMPADPPHEFDDVRLQLLGTDAAVASYGSAPVINSGFVRAYQKVAGTHPLTEVMACFAPEQLPILTTLAREFCVCDRWFSSVPGPTIPNRLFVHAGTAGGDPSSPDILSLISAATIPEAGYQFKHGNVFRRMTENYIPWRLYHGDSFAMAYALDGVSFGSGRQFDPRNQGQLDRFKEDLDRDDLPTYLFIEPNWGNLLQGTYKGGNSQHPMDDIASGEELIKAVYEAIRGSTVWNRSVLIVTYDEHGGFYDHVAPPGGVGVPAPGDVKSKNGFEFTQLGVRVPAVIISPWIPRNLIDHTTYDHTSVLATLRQRLPWLGSFTARDSQANGLSHLFSLSEPRTDSPLQLPPVAIYAGAALVPDSIEDANDADLASFLGADDPVTSTQVGFVHAAFKLNLQVAPGEREAILERVAGIRTTGEAKQYLRDVKKLLDAQPPGS